MRLIPTSFSTSVVSFSVNLEVNSCSNHIIKSSFAVSSTYSIVLFLLTVQGQQSVSHGVKPTTFDYSCARRRNHTFVPSKVPYRLVLAFHSINIRMPKQSPFHTFCLNKNLNFLSACLKRVNHWHTIKNMPIAFADATRAEYSFTTIRTF